MTRFLLILTTFFSASVFADDSRPVNFNFTYFGNHSGGYSMVACDYAEYQARELLTKFGAEIQSIWCTGGIDAIGIRPLSLNIRFLPATSEGRTTTRETFESDPWSSSCDFNTKLVRDLVRQTPNVRIVRSFDACFGANSSFSYVFEVR